MGRDVVLDQCARQAKVQTWDSFPDLASRECGRLADCCRLAYSSRRRSGCQFGGSHGVCGRLRQRASVAIRRAARAERRNSADGHCHGVPTVGERPGMGHEIGQPHARQTRSAPRETRTTARAAAASGGRPGGRRTPRAAGSRRRNAAARRPGSAGRRASTSSSNIAGARRRTGTAGPSRRPARTVPLGGDTMKSRLLSEPSGTRLRRASSTAMYANRSRRK